jgi:superfamily I DNA and/or RNA helicase/very-short-patch-repair endonuclease
MKEKNNKTIQLINELWDQRFATAAKDDTNYREFKRLATLKRRQRPIRKYMELYNDVLINLFPCFLMGPKTVSDVLPIEADLFDVVIFDEASQMFVEESIPSVFRGKNIIVAGDDKQLKPTSLFKKRYEEEISDDDYHAETAAALEEESLLDLAKITYNPSHLNFHYRSKYSELINFSNHAFYDGKLKLVPNIGKDESIKPIERIFVENGLWENRSNKEEAIKVISLLKQIFDKREKHETIGVITFNITQKDLILDLIEIEMSKDDRFKEYIQKEQNRYKGNEDISLFVKNIENVQGDERDIIVFSTGYAKNNKGRMYSNFGALSKDGGENRLNVAVSRAKTKVYVVTSFEPEELIVENSKNNGPKLFKKYLQYSREISNGNLNFANDILEELSNIGVITNRDVRFDSDFEEEVYNVLQQKGYDVETQIGTSGYLIDLAIYDNITSSYVLGIECDGATYHGSPSARERDVHRQKFLESRGWIIERIWSTDWWKSKKQVINSLIPTIEAAIDKRHSEYKVKNRIHKLD